MSLKSKLKALLKARSQGKELYGKADALLEQVVAEMKPGDEVDIGGGRKVQLVDQFATKSKVWKPCGVSRFDVKVIE